MSPLSRKVLDQALAMPEEERVELTERLWTSLSDEHRAQVDAAWIEECERRMEACEKGAMRIVSGDEAMNRLRNRRT